MDGIEVKITGNLIGDFEKTSKKMPDIERKALYRAAFFLRDKIRNQLLTKVPKANTRNPKYNDTLIDAVGFTKVDGASITVNAMGANRPGSGAFRARFFERGTRARYQKERKGIKLRKKKYIGQIGPTNFFSDAVNANRGAVIDIIRKTILEHVEETS